MRPRAVLGFILNAAALRETREEAGSRLAVRPLGIVHAYTYRFDAKLRTMTSIAYLLARGWPGRARGRYGRQRPPVVETR
ncbi:hypothetical protein BH18CHL2_BH18CHL2_07380 [soil metagenome]